MQRLNLPEIEDQRWCPPWLRNYTTDFLQIFMTRLDPYASVRPLLLEALRHCGTHRIVDLCSGGGGPWPRFFPEIIQQMAGQAKLWLTDLYPNQQSCGDLQRKFPDKVKWWLKPLAASDLPTTLPGFITQFSATHHLSPDELQKLLRQAVEQRRGIACFELAHRSARAMLLVFLMPLVVFLLTPGLRPMTLGRVLFTYFIPLVPLIVFYDGFASCLRSYTPGDFRKIIDGLGETDYQWSIGEQPSAWLPIPVTYLVGVPKDSLPAREG